MYLDGITGRSLAEIPLNRDGQYERTFGTPYLTIQRRRVQEALLSQVDQTRLHLNHRVEGVEVDGDAVYLAFENGQSLGFDAVVGADGARSCVRNWITGSDEAVYSGTSAFRGIVPLSAAPSVQRGDAAVFWVGAGKHLLHYPVGGDAVTFFAAVEEPPTWDHAEWRVPVSAEEALDTFDGWHPAVTELVGADPRLERWALFVVRPLERWSRGPVVVIGDAAHAMLPHQGQGANQAMEDAVLLADVLLRTNRAGIRQALVAFEQARGPRTRRVQELSWVTNHLLHVPKGPEWEQRNEVLPNFYETVRWIHSFELPASRAIPPAHQSE
jgi:salicylate hydroxylase